MIELDNFSGREMDAMAAAGDAVEMLAGYPDYPDPDMLNYGQREFVVFDGNDSQAVGGSRAHGSPCRKRGHPFRRLAAPGRR